MSAFSLPTQRCFLVVKRIREINALFSAYAEVFLSQIALSMMMLTFLCLRRGVSEFGAPLMRRQTFSLPTQRCFLLRNPWVVVHELFSAYAEVFPDDYDHHLEGGAFLCLRRGVSEKEARLYRYRNFSLPTQRCFRHFDSSVRPYLLFSAYAEVFPHFI